MYADMTLAESDVTESQDGYKMGFFARLLQRLEKYRTHKAVRKCSSHADEVV